MNLEQQILSDIVIKKQCGKCKKEKTLNNFCKDSRRKDGLHFRCRECNNSYIKKYQKENSQKGKKYREQNKEKLREISKKWYGNNKEKHSQKVEVYQIKNKKKLDEFRKEYYQTSLKFNVDYKIAHSIRSRLYECLKLNKNLNSIKYLGCLIQDYKIYLESLFKLGMTWENWGEIWEIDHILPISSFDLTLEENIHKAFNYKNTQPLFKTSKIAKSLGYNEIGNKNKSCKI